MQPLDNSGVPQASCSALRIAEDYPEPLTETQRKLFQRHVFSLVIRYNSVHKTTLLISKGLGSLKKIMDRLVAERDYLRESLEKVLDTAPQTSAEAPPRAVTNTQARRSEAPTRRGFGRIAMIHNVLLSARQEEESYAKVTAQREKISKEIRLQQIEKDLEEHLPSHGLLTNKMNRCIEVEAQMKGTLLPLLLTEEEMMIYEPLYASAFALRAIDDSSDSPSSQFFQLPFKPSVFNPELEGVLRSQIEGVLDTYVGYRSRIDPILSKLEEEQQSQRAKQVKKLLDLIGAKDDTMEIVSSQVDHDPPTSIEQAENLLDISDSSSDESADAQNHESDQVDRQLVQSALTALDDFQDLY